MCVTAYGLDRMTGVFNGRLDACNGLATSFVPCIEGGTPSSPWGAYTPPAVHRPFAHWLQPHRLSTHALADAFAGGFAVR